MNVRYTIWYITQSEMCIWTYWKAPDTSANYIASQWELQYVAKVNIILKYTISLTIPFFTMGI